MCFIQKRLRNIEILNFIRLNKHKNGQENLKFLDHFLLYATCKTYFNRKYGK